jgi:hypothetical protein
MKLWSDGLDPGGPIPARYALGRPDPTSHVTFSDNVSPPLAWSTPPRGTRSLALVCVDADAPSRRDDANQEDRDVPADLPRVPFFHWVLADLPPDARHLGEGEFASGVVPRGKRGPLGGPRGTRQGLNDYTGWFGGDPAMEGDYFGYDGPCPPWNDSIVHHYTFTMYALDVPHLPAWGPFTGSEALAALRGRVLAQASLVGTYAINPRARDLGGR